LSVLVSVILVLAMLALCLCSAALLKEPQSRALRDHFQSAGCITLAIIVFAGFSILFTIGAFGRGEASPFPWDEFWKDLPRNGFLSAIGKALEIVLAELWLFLIPGHLWAKSIAGEKARRPIYPYVINILVGLLLCTPWNPIYSLIDHIHPSGEYP
jgi:phosphotransferase system  glucose/maltose/N-acetylglucosamine-specific IIC component